MSTINIINTDETSKDEWKSIEETIYLSSIPGLVENVNDIREHEDWNSAKEFNSKE